MDDLSEEFYGDTENGNEGRLMLPWTPPFCVARHIFAEASASSWRVSSETKTDRPLSCEQWGPVRFVRKGENAGEAGSTRQTIALVFKQRHWPKWTTLDDD